MPDPTIRLTMAQALVRYLQVQYSERDGEARRLIPAMFGIFGHGNVAGLGQALDEYGGDLPYYQARNEQSMVHTATGFAKATRRRATLACTVVDRPGRDEHDHRRGAGDDQPPAGAAAARDYYATRRQGPVLQQLEHPSRPTSASTTASARSAASSTASSGPSSC